MAVAEDTPMDREVVRGAVDRFDRAAARGPRLYRRGPANRPLGQKSMYLTESKCRWRNSSVF